MDDINMTSVIIDLIENSSKSNSTESSLEIGQASEEFINYESLVFNTYPTGLLEFAAACCIIFTIIGVPANLLNAAALLKSPRLRNATTAFIVNLCLADGFFCASSLPLAASTFLHKKWVHGHVACVLFPMLRYSNIAVSLFTVNAITVNRYILVCHPNRYRLIYTKCRMTLMIISLWVFAWALLFPPLVGAWGQFGFDPAVGTCTILPLNGRSPKMFLYVAVLVVPSIFIVACYSRIWCTVRKSSKNVQQHSESNSNRSESDLRLLKIVLVIFLTFLVCFLPVALVKILRKEDDLPVANVFGYLGVFVSACTNPIIYVLMSREYRRAYVDLFKC